MASSKVMTTTSNSRNSDHSRHASTASPSTRPTSSRTQQHHPTSMTFYNNDLPSQSTLTDAQISLMETPIAAVNAVTETETAAAEGSSSQRTVDDFWREIVTGERKDVKEEALGSDEMMTLEDFLARASGVGVEGEGEDVKVEIEVPGGGGVFPFDAVTPGGFGQFRDQVEGPIVAYNGGEVVGRGRRGRGSGGAVLEPMDKATEQRQRRMIKNRESAARSRERKQAYQNELECLAARLEEENEELKKEKAEKIRKRLQQLKEDIIPVEEKRRPAKALRRTHSWNCSMLV